MWNMLNELYTFTKQEGLVGHCSFNKCIEFKIYNIVMTAKQLSYVYQGMFMTYILF
mgnify:CR=1 FL=1